MSGSEASLPDLSRLSRFALLLSGVGVRSRERTLLAVAEAVAKQGVPTDIVTAGAPAGLEEALSERLRLVDLRRWWMCVPGVRRSSKMRMYASTPVLAWYLRRYRPEILLSASIPPNLVALWAQYLAGSKTAVILRQSNVVHSADPAYRGVRPRSRDKHIPRWYPRASAVVTVAQDLQANIRQVGGVPAERIYTVPNQNVPPNLGEWEEETVDHAWLAGNRHFRTLIAAGRMVAKKDYPTLLRAFSRVRQCLDVRLLILANDGPESLRVRAVSEELGVAGAIEQVGFQANPYAWFARADCFVLSSISEGMPNVLVEALACGCPVVSTDCPTGPAEILGRGEYGRLVPVGDSEGLARAIVQTLTEPADRARLRARGRAFTRDRAVASYLRIIAARARNGRLPGAEQPDTY